MHSVHWGETIRFGEHFWKTENVHMGYGSAAMAKVADGKAATRLRRKSIRCQCPAFLSYQIVATEKFRLMRLPLKHLYTYAYKKIIEISRKKCVKKAMERLFDRLPVRRRVVCLECLGRCWRFVCIMGGKTPLKTADESAKNMILFINSHRDRDKCTEKRNCTKWNMNARNSDLGQRPPFLSSTKYKEKNTRTTKFDD